MSMLRCLTLTDCSDLWNNHFSASIFILRVKNSALRPIMRSIRARAGKGKLAILGMHFYFLRLVLGILRSLGLCFHEARTAATPLCMAGPLLAPFVTCHVLELYSGMKGSALTDFCFRRERRCIMTSSRKMGSLLAFPPCRECRQRWGAVYCSRAVMQLDAIQVYVQNRLMLSPKHHLEILLNYANQEPQSTLSEKDTK